MQMLVSSDQVLSKPNFKKFLPSGCGDTATKFLPLTNAKFRVAAKFRSTEPLRKFIQIL